MNRLTVSSVSVRYGAREAVRNVSFTLDEGDYLCVVGANGSGKSTLIKAITGLLPLSSGEIRHEGIGANEIGYLPQQTGISRDFPATVGEIVRSGNLNRLGFRPFYSKSDRERTEQAMKSMKIANLRSLPFSDLSGGQRQRVLLARALCAAKKALILDEPVTGLDPMITEDFYRAVREANEKGVAVITVTHDIERALSEADKILHMDTECRFFGSVKHYAASELFEEFRKGAEK